MKNKKINLYVVGDSTLALFHDAYYYPRYGYATKFNCFFDSNVNIINLALSGRSSKSFIKENNYLKLREMLGKDDYLLIGFGHNDEKSDDNLRFTSANLDIDNKNSFKYYLYEYYIKLALEKGAIPILCTPIVRNNASNDYTGISGHITNNGNYPKAIIDLANEMDVYCIDLTTITKKLYLSLGYEEACYFHAWINSSIKSVDATHLNTYGAKIVAYFVCNEIKNTKLSLANHVINLIKPTKSIDLTSNPDYKEPVYEGFDEKKYTPKTWTGFSKGWYGTAFGDCGDSPIEKGNCFLAYQKNNEFIVGQNAGTPKGRISIGTDGIAMIFKQVSIDENIKISANVKVLETKEIKQSGFGLMIRDDIYVEQNLPNSNIRSNYIAAGFYTTDGFTNIIYNRENTTFSNEDNIETGFYEKNDEAYLEITRLGQSINVLVNYKGKSYEKNYYDFDLTAIDNKYYYIGMFATRGTVCSFSDVVVTNLGKAIKA